MPGNFASASSRAPGAILTAAHDSARLAYGGVQLAGDDGLSGLVRDEVRITGAANTAGNGGRGSCGGRGGRCRNGESRPQEERLGVRDDPDEQDPQVDPGSLRIESAKEDGVYAEATLTGPDVLAVGLSKA